MKNSKTLFIFTKAINGCQSLAGLYVTSVNVKRLVNPYRGLSTHNRPAKSKCVEVNCEGSFILKCLKLSISLTHISSVSWASSLKIVTFPGKGLLCYATKWLTCTTNKTEFPLTCILRDRSETINDRQPKLKDNDESQSLTLGGEGLRLVFVSLSFSISFSPAGSLTLIV